ncbi:hypothetical protein [Siminovitchia fordii]|uniref:Uncharacterized protein n=1 Tax=Siminovitchia fordii TaxID=254759 RepID=A0ABQ4K9V5_9BACI|nr:hypothetical protein [Siminovitchia fordii]GIN22499.1 hypothetical protein J1TS3_36330 [Siminovitchia fordii]
MIVNKEDLVYTVELNFEEAKMLASLLEFVSRDHTRIHRLKDYMSDEEYDLAKEISEELCLHIDE